MNKKVLHHKTMSLRTLSLIITLIFVTAGLFLLALTTPYSTPQKPQIIPSVPPAILKAQTVLRFDNPYMSETLSSSYSLAIRIITGANMVTAVQLELSFDPKLLTNMSIKEGPFFTNPVTLLKNINSATGKISYALGISPQARGVQGEGIIAILEFQAKSQGPKATTISFLPKTLVTAEGIEMSVIKSAIPAEFIVGQNVKYTK